MRAVLQRVKEAAVSVADRTLGQISGGLVILLGITPQDTQKDIDYIVSKSIHLRIFDDEAGVMNRSVEDAGGEILLVSQFTLMGDARHGRRPSYIAAARPAEALPVYTQTVRSFEKTGLIIKTGEFGADMQVSLVNDGPVTILLDSEKQF